MSVCSMDWRGQKDSGELSSEAITAVQMREHGGLG